MTEKREPPMVLAARAVAERQLATLQGCALLIGVEEYPSFPDRALLAGRNDVLTYWKVCRRLGYQPELIRVRTSPVLTEDDILRAEVELALGRKRNRGKSREEVLRLVKGELSRVQWDEVLGDASHASIVSAVQWLAKHLVYNFNAEWEGRKYREELGALPGLLAYSGHGAQVPGDLVLCPSDVRRSADGLGLDNALRFADLRAMLDEGDEIAGGCAPTDNLTVVLDCCFAAAGEDHDSMITSSLTPKGTPAAPPATEIGNRIFCASGRDEQAYQAMLGGRWHGAFTWAFTRALEQWTTVPSGRFKKSTITHVELLFRARMLLEALSFPQHPVLVDRIGNTPVFWHESDLAGRGETKSEPDAERLGVQMDPGEKDLRFYTYTDGAGMVVAHVLVSRAGVTLKNVTYAALTEYWFDVPTAVPRASLTVTWADYAITDGNLPTPGTLSFSMDQRATWTPTNGPLQSETTFYNNDLSIGLSWGVILQGTRWGGFFLWFNTSGTNSVFSGRAPEKGVTLTANVQAGNAAWYMAPVYPGQA